MDLKGFVSAGLNYSLNPEEPNAYLKIWKFVFLVSFDKVLESKLGLQFRLAVFMEK